MNKKECVIIDDVDLKDEIESLEISCKRKGLSVSISQLNPNEYLNKERKVDREKFNQDVIKKVRRAHVVACDYGLGADLDGLMLAKTVRRNNKICRIVLYSGKLVEIIKEVVGEDEDFGAEAVLRRIRDIVVTNISDFLDREHYDEGILEQLMAISTDQTLVNLLQSHEKLMFRTGEVEFDGMTFGDLAQSILSKSDVSAKQVHRILEIAIANIAQLNASA